MNLPGNCAVLAEGICSAYGAKPVLCDVSFEIPAGSAVGLIGLNGAGKTTLIKIILGLRRQTTGNVRIFGEFPDAASARMRISYLPERFEPPWFLTGREFLGFSCRLYNKKYDDAFILKALDSVELDSDALDRRVQTYSKGMRQKLGLLSATLVGCDLMIFDEPMSGLDPKARENLKKTLKSERSAGKTIFLSSHIIADMDEICDLVAILHMGRIVFWGKPSLLIDRAGAPGLESSFLRWIENVPKS